MLRKLLIALVLAGTAVPAVTYADEPGQGQVEEGGRSGFWTSRRPAVGGAYRWRLLGLGVVLAGLTGFGMLRLVRKANAERAARDAR